MFGSGATSLPSASVEIQHPDVPAYAMNYGVAASKLAIQAQRSGLLDATVSLIAQGEKPTAASSGAGSPSTLVTRRFTQFSGQITRLGVSLGDVVSGNFTYDNGLDPVEVIRQDGRIAGVDAGEASAKGQVTLRFKDTTLMDLATSGTPIDITYAWALSATEYLQFTFHEVYLPRPKRPITGPNGIQVTFDWQAAKNATATRMMTVTLVNDQSSI